MKTGRARNENRNYLRSNLSKIKLPRKVWNELYFLSNVQKDVTEMYDTEFEQLFENAI